MPPPSTVPDQPRSTPHIAPRRQKCQLTARVAVRWPGATPARPRALLGIHLHPVSGAQRGDQGSSRRNPSGRRTQPSRPQGPRSGLPPPHPSPSLWLEAPGRGLLPSPWGGPREPPRCSEVGPGSLGKVIPAREFPPLLESRTSPITKGTLCLRRGQRQRAERGPSRAIPGDCLVLPLCLPCPPTSRGSYARSLTFGQRKGLGSRGLLR